MRTVSTLRHDHGNDVFTLDRKCVLMNSPNGWVALLQVLGDVALRSVGVANLFGRRPSSIDPDEQHADIRISDAVCEGTHGFSHFFSVRSGLSFDKLVLMVLQ